MEKQIESQAQAHWDENQSFVGDEQRPGEKFY